jgi:hypothetical protein
LIHLLGYCIIRKVSVVIVDLFKEEMESCRGGVSNDESEVGGGGGEGGGEAIAPLAEWPT